MSKDLTATFSDSDYTQLLDQVKKRIREARVRAALAANAEAILMYWDIGIDILDRQQREGWGAHVVERLSRDIRREFPDTKGFSSRNLQYMRAFAEAYPDRAIVQQAVAQLPWGHILHLLHKAQNTHLSKMASRTSRICQTLYSFLALKNWPKPVVACIGCCASIPTAYPPSLWSSDRAQFWRGFAHLAVDAVNRSGVYCSWLIAPRWIIRRKANSGGVIFCPQGVAV